MNAHYGVRTNPTYDNDPNSLVDWQGAAPYPGCVVTSNVGAGGTFPLLTTQSESSFLVEQIQVVIK